jgi:hypothetical protein
VTTKHQQKSGRKSPVHGPEVWRDDETGTWSYWDLWFCVVCVADHGGDWAALDAAITGRRSLAGDRDGEAKWSHLLDVRERLADAELTAEVLAGPVATDRNVIAKARTKVVKQALPDSAYTSAMINTPRRRRERRMLYGHWPLFPVSPQPAFDMLETRHHVVDRYRGEQATMTLASKLADSMDKLEAKASADPARLLAVRRAELTLAAHAMESCDDSFGQLGDLFTETVEEYAGTDWRATGITPKVYWWDLLEICCALSDYGLLHKREAVVLERAGAARDADLVEEVLAELHADYVEARMTWHADELLSFRVALAVATQAFDRFEQIAAALGSRSWLALDALVAAAVKGRHPEIAQRVLAAADVPGTHQGWVRERRAELSR